MKILHTVENYKPSVGGMQEVVAQLSERLATFGHDVTVATSVHACRSDDHINGVKVAPFNVEGNLVRGMKGEVQAYREFLLNSRFDIVTNFAAQQWATDIALPLLDEISGVKVFVPTGFSGLYYPEYSSYFCKMKDWLHDYDMNIFLSNGYRDINFARECGVQNIIVIPNGASEEEFLAEDVVDIRSVLNIPKEHFLVLTVGSHTGAKGHREAIEIFHKSSITDATFLMIANDVENGCGKSCMMRRLGANLALKSIGKRKKIVIQSLTRKETLAAYREADVFLFPSNIECSPLVLFECMASRTPFLTSNAGNAKEIITWSHGGELLPTKSERNGYLRVETKESACILDDIWSSPQRRERMAENGFRSWKDRFTWDRIARSYEQVYTDLVHGRHSATTSVAIP